MFFLNVMSPQQDSFVVQMFIELLLIFVPEQSLELWVKRKTGSLGRLEPNEEGHKENVLPSLA